MSEQDGDEGGQLTLSELASRREVVRVYENGLVRWADDDVEPYRGLVALLKTGWIQLENGALYPPTEVKEVLP